MKEETRPEAEGLPNWNGGVEEPEVGEAEYLLETTSPLGADTEQDTLLDELDTEHDPVIYADITAETYENLEEVSLDYDFETETRVASD